MPGLLDDTRAVLRCLAHDLSPDTYVNLMDQYRPAWKVLADPQYAALRRPLTSAEFAEAQAIGREVGLWRFDER
jgi:putative pyruvate formate lyase activating enzyme